MKNREDCLWIIFSNRHITKTEIICKSVKFSSIQRGHKIRWAKVSNHKMSNTRSSGSPWIYGLYKNGSGSKNVKLWVCNFCSCPLDSFLLIFTSETLRKKTANAAIFNYGPCAALAVFLRSVSSLLRPFLCLHFYSLQFLLHFWQTFRFFHIFLLFLFSLPLTHFFLLDSSFPRWWFPTFKG